MAYCDRCERYFSSYSALEQHERDSNNHHLCSPCGIDFSTWTGLEQHWVQSWDHSYCQQCQEHFDDEDDLEDHYHQAHDYCGSCRRIFRNEFGLHEHNRQSHSDRYCVSCKHLFIGYSQLRAHLNSSTHRPRDIRCPYRDCPRTFISHSDVAQHLESGSCASGVNRQVVDRVVRSYDRQNVITDPSRLITSGGNTNNSFIATSASWNGSGYECYFCHREYRALAHLNQHLASPAHADEIYRCPGPNCGVHFRVLSALCQHIESERCGVMKFRQVQNAMDSILGGMRRLTMA